MERGLIPFDDVQRMGQAIASSGLFGIKTPAQAIALALVAQAEGRHPASAAQDYHVINGRPSLKADAMLGRFLTAGGRVEWHELTDKKADATFSHDAGGSVRIDWTMDRAKAAGLLGNPTWKKYPRAMLRARLVSEGVRTVFPSVLGGMYTPEEVRGFTEEEAPADADFELVDDTPAPAPEPPAEEDPSSGDGIKPRLRILSYMEKRLAEEFGDGPPWEPVEKARVIKDLFGSGKWKDLHEVPMDVLRAATVWDTAQGNGDPTRTRFERVIRLVGAGIRRPDECAPEAWPGSTPEPTEPDAGDVAQMEAEPADADVS